MNLDELTLEELKKIANEPFRCEFLDECDSKKYDCCYNHSHVLCANYEVLYQKYKNL